MPLPDQARLFADVCPKIRVDVDYLDDHHKSLLSALPNAGDVERLVSGQIDIDTADFLTYGVFHLQDPGRPTHATYAYCSKDSDRTVRALQDLVVHNGASLALVNMADIPNELPERIGEAVGLCVLGRLYGLHEADWHKLRIERGRGASKTLDWEKTLIASDAQTFVELETKGSRKVDNTTNDGLRTHIDRIKDKKIAQRNLTGNSKMLFGTITVIDPRPGSVLKCWLLDPPTNEEDVNPRTFRLIARMEFLSKWIGFVSPRSQLAATLSTRLGDIKELADPFELDLSPLRDGLGEPLNYPAIDEDGHSRFFASQSLVDGTDAGGVIVPWSETELAFFGFRQSLVNMSTNQNFEVILTYSFDAELRFSTIQCRVSDARFLSMRLGGRIEGDRPRGGYHYFRLKCLLSFSTGGLVFGLIPLNDFG